MSIDIDREKQQAALAGAAMVEPGMLLGLGTGSTAAYLVPALAGVKDLTCIATSPAIEALARAHGVRVVTFEGIGRLDMAIDGADQVDTAGWLVKGGGGAHTREKIVAAAADRFVVIVSSNKMVGRVSPPVPLELMVFGLDAVLRAVPGVQLREAPTTPDGGVLADYHGEVDDPERLCARFADQPGIVDHGLFPPALVSTVLVGRRDQVEVIDLT